MASNIDLVSGKQQRMSVVDTAWLRMDTPDNLMMITSVLIFEDHLPLEKFKSLIATKFLSFPRFNQKVVSKRSGAFLEDVVDVDLDHHISVVNFNETEGPIDEGTLRAHASNLMSTPLDEERPLWHIDYIEHYQEGSALAIRLHHCYADGIALVSVLNALADDDDQELLNQLHPEQPNQVIPANRWQAVWELPNIALKGLTLTLKLLLDALRIITLSKDAHSELKSPLGTNKKVAWATPLPLDDVKKAAKALNCTVNDLLVACVSGSIRSYLDNNDEQYQGGDLRATLPYNLRPLEKATELGNKFGLIYLDLPVGEADSLKRVTETQRRMNRLKGTTQPLVSFLTLGLLGFGPKSLQRKSLEFFSSKASAVMTNVPGPKKPIYLAGAKLKKPLVWVPQSGHIGLGISVFSYNNQVEFGLVADQNLVSDPQLIIDQFQPEFAKIINSLAEQDVEIEAHPA